MARRQKDIPDADQAEFSFELPSAPEEKPQARESVNTAVAEKPAPIEKPAAPERPATALPPRRVARTVPAKPAAAPVPKVVIKPADDPKPSAFETILHTELGRIFNLCLRLTQDAELADDLTQEVFVRAAKTDDPSPLWLIQETLAIFRRDRRYGRPRRPVPPPPTEGSPAKSAPPVFELPDAWAGVSEEHRTLLCALGTLDADDRVMIVLKDLEDMSYPEAARALDVSESSARSRVAAARERLHHAVKRLDDGKKP